MNIYVYPKIIRIFEHWHFNLWAQPRFEQKKDGHHRITASPTPPNISIDILCLSHCGLALKEVCRTVMSSSWWFYYIQSTKEGSMVCWVCLVSGLAAGGSAFESPVFNPTLLQEASLLSAQVWIWIAGVPGHWSTYLSDLSTDRLVCASLWYTK